MQNSDRRKRLQINIAYFRHLAAPHWQLLPSDSAIQALILGSSERALKISQALYQQGFWVTAIRPPTVPHNTARLRITLSAAHSQPQIKALIHALNNLLP